MSLTFERMKRIFFLILVLIILPVSVSMQNGEVKNVSQNPFGSPDFQHFTNEDGLPQNSIFCIFQDRRGFLWIGTFHGLGRFDGYQFVKYTRDFQDAHSLSDNRINSIIETKSGEIWIGTRNGLNHYNYATNNFDSYMFEAKSADAIGDSWINAVFEDHEGTLWVGANQIGLNKFDRTTGKFTAHKNDPNNPESLSDNNVFGICEDKNGNLWIATSGGLNKFDRETGRFKRYLSDAKNPNSLSDNRINAMLIDRAGIIWLATGKGLNKFDTNTELFTRYFNDKSNPNSLNNNDVRSIYETKTGVFWVGTLSGLNRYVKENDNFIVYKHEQANPRSLTEGVVLSIVEDNMEQLWIGTSTGLNKYNQKKARFQVFRHDPNDPNSLSKDNIYSMAEDKNNNVWIALSTAVGGGLIEYKPGEQRFESLKDFNEYVSALFVDRDGKMLIGTAKGLFYLDTDKHTLTPFKNDSNDAGLKSAIAICEDRAGNLWIGTLNGEVRKFNRLSGEVKRIQYKPNTANLSNYRVLAIYEDSQGQIWIGTRNGLTMYNPDTESFTQYVNEPDNPNSITANAVGAIYEDKHGTLWFGTSSGGLNRFDRKTETFTPFTEREGMPINNVYEILEDEQNHLWLSTDKGLARLDIGTKTFRNFDVNDGLPHNEFNDRAALKDRNGEMYFGTPDGFMKFNPKDFTDSEFKPPIYLTDIRVLEQPLKTKENLTVLRDLNLSWRDYVVSFEFAALDFTDSNKLQYQWKLEGFDPEWINGGTRRTATYTNLPGGSYTLKVKATNVDGIWTEESLLLKINVTPPFYRTFWFLGLVSIAIGILIWLMYRYRLNQLRTINEAQTRFTQQLITSQEAERKRIASELHDGLGQSLVVIKNRAMLGIKKGDDAERVVKELSNISESATQALEEVREITNNLRPQLLDRLGLTKALTAMCKKVSGVVEIDCDVDLIDNLFSENEEISIYRIVQESVNNIIKHSNASNAIVTIKRDENKLQITIEDNGKGFDVGNAKFNGSGLGLIGLKERAQLLNGEIVIDSKIGEGTKIELLINAEARTK